MIFSHSAHVSSPDTFSLIFLNTYNYASSSEQDVMFHNYTKQWVKLLLW